MTCFRRHADRTAAASAKAERRRASTPRLNWEEKMTVLSIHGTLRRAKFLSGCAAITAAFIGLAAETIAFAEGSSGPVEGTIEYGYWGNARRAELTEAVSRA